MSDQLRVFTVPVKFSVEGEFEIVESSFEAAVARVMEDGGLTVGGDIHDSMDDDRINWDFPRHMDKEVLFTETITGRKLKKGEKL